MESSYCFLCTTTAFRCLFCVCYCLWLWLHLYSKMRSFLHCWGGGIKGRDFTGLVFSLKGNSHNIPALAISKDPPYGMRMDLAFPRRTERICYSKCPLIYSRKLQRFQTQCPSLSSLANTRGFTVVLPVCCSRHCGSVWHPSDTTHNLYSQLGPFWEHVQALFQPSQDNISLLSVTWLPDCRQHFALVRFCESRRKNNSFYFSFSSLMC